MILEIKNMWKLKYYDIDNGPDWVGLENEDWFVDMKHTPQDAIWHAEGDVQIHTKMVCEELIKHKHFLTLNESEKHILFTAALMHDIEKRSTTMEEFKDGRICLVAPHHASRGEKTARNLLYQEFNCPFEIREKICKLIKHHGKPLHSCTERNMVSLSTQISLHWLALIAEVDILGRICNDAVEHLERIEFFRMYAEEIECYHQPRKFYSNLAQFLYFHNDKFLTYEPFEEKSFEVILMCGLPGSGKDTYVNSLNLPVVSLDDIRLELKIKPSDKSGNGKVIQLAKERAKEFLRKKHSFIWNATNVTADRRKQLIELFVSYGAQVKIVFIEVPFQKLMEQNQNRVAVVPGAIMKNMISNYDPPIIEEAHFVEYNIKS